MSDLFTLHHGDALDVLTTLPDHSVDSVVTDPPYSMEFMGLRWDSWESARVFQTWCTSWAAECLRILKPGGYLLSFGGTRTSHRLASGIEDAGFELRDSIVWIYASGYPKSSSSLKPAHEPIVVARKPLSGTIAATQAAHGTGGLNIDGCRVPSAERLVRPAIARDENTVFGHGLGVGVQVEPAGRWPPNVILEEGAATLLDRESGTLSSGLFLPQHADNGKGSGTYGAMAGRSRTTATYGDSGGASRFFPVFHYAAKAPKSERLEVDGVRHTTVKPLALMRWLVRLATPPGGICLDPFVGSGTTAEACVLEQLHCVAIEREDMYLPLIAARMERHS